MNILLEAVLSVVLSTNVFVQWPKVWEPIPSPDLSAHFQSRDDLNSKTRLLVTEVRQITTLRIPQFERSIELSNAVISRVERAQSLTVAWADSEAKTNQTSLIAFGGSMSIPSTAPWTNLFFSPSLVPDPAAQLEPAPPEDGP